MRVAAFRGIFTSGFLALTTFLPATAQVTPDGTSNTTVNPNGNNFTIINGIEKGNNLFHSFSNFSVPTGGSAQFDLTNTPNITTIFSRVTGGNVSNIDGLIQTVNSTNPVSLFLMNPAGITFGKDARLNVSGSFVGTTASSIKFADGVEFSSVNPTANPLLTVSVPVGLGMGSNPGAITVNGSGHGLTTVTAGLSPLTPTNTSGLQVPPGKTLALVGGDVIFNGGIAKAPTGRVEIGSANGGNVYLDVTKEKLTFDYSSVEKFRDIHLLQQSLVSTTGSNAGSIHLQAGSINLAENSVVWAQNQGSQVGGTISINAKESLNLKNGRINVQTGIVSETVAAGNSGAIDLTTGRLVLEDGAIIHSRTFSNAESGKINVNAFEFVKVGGFSPTSPTNVSAIAAFTVRSGKAGDINLSTRQLSVFNGGTVLAGTFGQGSSGNVRVDADAITVSDVTPSLLRSALVSSSFGSGNAGTLNLNARTIQVYNGAGITSNSFGVGNAGNLTVNATESIEISHQGRINSSVAVLDEVRRTILKLPSVPSGTAGDLTIKTPILRVSNKGFVAVQNVGLGNAGSLRVNADLVVLDNRGNLSAKTSSGEGGNIAIQTQTLQLRRNSEITANAGSTGNGGNITINSPIIVGLENSDIIANAAQGRGGNIDITTQGIFGLKFRNELTEDSDITVSSELGINGVVNITTPEIRPDNPLQEQASNFVSTDNVVASSCLSSRNAERGRFVVTGNGGLPENPNDRLDLTYDLLQVQTVNNRSATTPQNITPRPWKIGDPIVEARGLQVINGKVLLTADSGGDSVSQASDLTCDLDLEAEK